jgi:hypothetical protein
MVKIEAAQRLRAAENRSLKTLLNIDGDLISFGGNCAVYRVSVPFENALSKLTRRFGEPKAGRRGNVSLYVWKIQGIDIVLSLDGSAVTLEIAE